MVKKIFSRLAVSGLLVFFATGCSEKTEYTHVIPADASAVIALDLQSISKKAGLSDAENQQFKLQIIDALKSGLNAATLSHLENILKDPSESGLNINDKIYIFTAPSLPFPAVLAKVDNEKKLRKTVGLLAEEQVLEPVTEADGYAYSMLGNNTVFAFSNSALIIAPLSGNSQPGIAGTLLKAGGGKKITEDKIFRKMSEGDGSILFYTSLDALPESCVRQLNAGLTNHVDLKNVMITGNVDFDKGKITAQIELHSDDGKVAEMLKKQDSATGMIKGDLLSQFPASTLAFFSVNVNGGEMYKLLDENDDLRKNFSIPKAAQVKDLFNSFDGDVSVGLTGVSMTHTPTFIAFANAGKGADINSIYDSKNELGLAKGEDILKLADNEYVYKSRSGNIFFGYKDKYIYATNDELLYKNTGKLKGASLKEARYAPNIEGKRKYLVIDIEAVSQLPIIQMMLVFGGSGIAAYYNIATRISYLEFTEKDLMKYDINIVLKNKEENAIKQILDLARAMAGS